MSSRPPFQMVGVVFAAVNMHHCTSSHCISFLSSICVCHVQLLSVCVPIRASTIEHHTKSCLLSRANGGLN